MDYQISGQPGNLFAQTVTIPNAASVSEMISTQGKALVGILMPSAWTAADVGYKACLTGRVTDMLAVYDSGGNPVTTPIAASTHVVFPTPDAIFVPFLQIASVTTGTVTGVNQGAARTLILLFRNLID